MTVDASTANSTDVADWYAAVRPLCIARLKEAHDAKPGLFSRQLRGGRWDGTGQAEAVTSTAICLIALSRAGIDCRDLGVDKARSLQALADAVREGRYPGALGLMLWANTVNDGLGFDNLLERCGYDDDGLRRLIPRLPTMEVAWLLSGLLHEERRAATPLLKRWVDEAVAALLRRHGRAGLFVHAEGEAPLAHRLRRNVATFADQIYSVQALAFAHLGKGRREALEAGCRCADALLRRRGPLHQWWWHYDARDDSVSRHYPVFSVHQHGMAPMSFMALAAAGAAEYRNLAWPGLSWLRENELRQPMLDPEAGTIWRDIEVDDGAFGKRLRDIGEVFGLSRDEPTDPSRLRLNRETRPYEWGWCLMAGAQLATVPVSGHLA